ncbi:hypothetical protein Dimus_023053, partial [Dionaea muscipula]
DHSSSSECGIYLCNVEDAVKCHNYVGHRQQDRQLVAYFLVTLVDDKVLSDARRSMGPFTSSHANK